MSEHTNERNYLLDNLKFLLITLVVIGHCWGAYTGQSLFFKTVVTCIYSFHMPVFVFISGYFAKSPRGTAMVKLTGTLLVPYVLFFFLWQTKEYLHSGTFTIAVFNPPYHLWYLLSLFLWNLLWPILKSFRFYLSLSIIISLFIGLNATIAQSSLFERTIGLFPFFVLGNMCTPDLLFELHAKKYLVLPGLCAAGALAFITIRYNAINFPFLLWDRSYALNGLAPAAGMLSRSILMLLVAAIMLSLIGLTSAKKHFFTAAGSRTLPIYILHGFILPTFAARFKFWGTTITGDVLIVLFPFILTILLSWDQLDVFYKKAIAQINRRLLNTNRDQQIQKEPF